MLDAVDAFMLCPMIHKGPLNVFHPRYQCQITKENDKTHQTFCNHNQNF